MFKIIERVITSFCQLDDVDHGYAHKVMTSY